jgi:hypothetical protein
MRFGRSFEKVCESSLDLSNRIIYRGQKGETTENTSIDLNDGEGR